MTMAGRLRHAVDRARPGTFFHVAAVGGSRSAIETAFHRLEREGALVRVRKGLYWKGVDSRFGPGLPDDIDVAMEIAGRRGVGPAGWTASHVLGLSTQVPPVVDMAVPGRPPLPVDGIRFHARANLDRLALSFHEIALLELLRAWPLSSEAGWDDVVGVARDLESRQLASRDRIAAVTRREPPRVRGLAADLCAA